MINYRKDREPNTEYRDLLWFLLCHGTKSQSAHDEESWMYFSPPKMRFDIARDGAPLITERSFKGIWKSSIGEILAFINGARTLEQLREFGVSDRFWGPWVTEEKCAKRGLAAGDLGDASYGAVFHDFPTPEGPFNQVAAVVQQIKERPFDRSHRISNWYLPYLTRLKGERQRTVVTPCHGDMYFRVFRLYDEFPYRLNLHMTQHKADVITGLPNNMIQYAAFLIAMAHVTGYEVGELVIDLVDAHFYILPGSKDAQDFEQGNMSPEQAAYWMRTKEPRRFPTLQLVEDAPKDIFQIRTEHFILDEYDPHPAIKGIKTGI